LVTFTTLIGAAALQELVGKPDLAVVDCRFDLMNPEGGRRAFLAGHIPGARYADLNEDLSAPITAASGRHPLPAPQKFAATLSRLGVGPGTQVIAYDDSGGAYAARLWWMLRWVGHAAAAVLDGGIKTWICAGGALESGEGKAVSAAPGAGPLSIQADSSALIDAAEVEQRLADAAFLLIDARAAERYAGTVEPIDAVAGHIKGAVSQPFSANLGADGRFRPAPELRRMWERQLAGRSPVQVAAMCGSGVTACHNLLSLEVAGFSGAKLYAGSWSEWIRDPRRPIACGE
jgi:thiosulfate/3-mercaptopyruvate sulfurtransferase